MEKDFDRLFRNNCASRSSVVDQAASDFRRFWEASSSEDQAALKDWFASLSALDSSKPKFEVRVCLRVGFEERIGEDEFRKISLPIEAVIKAIEAFECDEPYYPKSLKELF